MPSQKPLGSLLAISHNSAARLSSHAFFTLSVTAWKRCTAISFSWSMFGGLPIRLPLSAICISQTTLHCVDKLPYIFSKMTPKLKKEGLQNCSTRYCWPICICKSHCPSALLHVPSNCKHALFGNRPRKARGKVMGQSSTYHTMDVQICKFALLAVCYVVCDCCHGLSGQDICLLFLAQCCEPTYLACRCMLLSPIRCLDAISHKGCASLPMHYRHVMLFVSLLCRGYRRASVQLRNAYNL